MSTPEIKILKFLLLYSLGYPAEVEEEERIDYVAEAVKYKDHWIMNMLVEFFGEIFIKIGEGMEAEKREREKREKLKNKYKHSEKKV
mgnify:CR=1 FL=1